MSAKHPSHEISPRRCLSCNAKAEVATNVAGKGGPEPGDANLCIQCGHLMVFDRNLSFREATAAEREVFDRDPDIIGARIAIKLVHGRATFSPGPRRRQ